MLRMLVIQLLISLNAQYTSYKRYIDLTFAVSDELIFECGVFLTQQIYHTIENKIILYTASLLLRNICHSAHTQNKSVKWLSSSSDTIQSLSIVLFFVFLVSCPTFTFTTHSFIFVVFVIVGSSNPRTEYFLWNPTPLLYYLCWILHLDHLDVLLLLYSIDYLMVMNMKFDGRFLIVPATSVRCWAIISHVCHVWNAHWSS